MFIQVVNLYLLQLYISIRWGHRIIGFGSGPYCFFILKKKTMDSSSAKMTKLDSVCVKLKQEICGLKKQQLEIIVTKPTQKKGRKQRCTTVGCDGNGNKNGYSKTHRTPNACPANSNKRKKYTRNNKINQFIDVEQRSSFKLKNLEIELRKSGESLLKLNNEKMFRLKKCSDVGTQCELRTDTK